ncbi:MAG: hypothetical protein WDZ68_00190 [Candidatus Paceibacterota bacterium]
MSAQIIPKKLRKLRTFNDDFARAKGKKSPSENELSPTPADSQETVQNKINSETNLVSKTSTTSAPSIKTTANSKAPIKPVRINNNTRTKPKITSNETTANSSTEIPKSKPAQNNIDQIRPSQVLVAEDLKKIRTHDKLSNLSTEEDMFEISEASQTQSGGSIITDRKRNRFNLLKEIRNSLSKWLFEQKEGYEEYTRPKHTVMPAFVRKDIIERAATASSVTPKDDHNIVAARLSKTPRTKTVRELSVKKASEVPKPEWGYTTSEKETSAEKKSENTKATSDTLEQKEETAPKPISAETTKKSVANENEIVPVTKPSSIDLDKIEKSETTATSTIDEALPKSPREASPSVNIDIQNQQTFQNESENEAPSETKPEIKDAPVSPSENSIHTPTAVTETLFDADRWKTSSEEKPKINIESTATKKADKIQAWGTATENEEVQSNTPAPQTKTKQQKSYEKINVASPSIPAAKTVATPSSQEASAPFVSPQKRSSIFGFAVIGIVASVLGIGVASWLFWGAGQTATIPTAESQSLVSSGGEQYVRLGQSHEQMLEHLASAIPNASQASVTTLRPMMTTVEGNERLATTAEILSIFDPRAPGSFTRAITGIEFGAYRGSEPFIVLKVTSFDAALSGMLTWETAMSGDLSPFFGQPVTSTFDATARNTSQTREPFFVDVVHANRDIRILRDDKQNERIVYTFLNRTTILLSTNRTVIEDVASVVR